MKKFYLGFILLVIISCNKQVDYSKDINELKSQISLLQGQIGGLRKTTDSLTNELKGINIQVSNISRKVDSILNRITVINTQLIDLNGQLSKNSTDITGLIKKIEDLQNELINLTKLIQDLKYQQIATSGYEIVPVDSRLKSNGKGVITVPVVIINYIPTSDGIYLDRWKTYDSRVVKQQKDILTLNRANEKILSEKIVEKLSAAIQNEKMVILKDYHSANSQKISDRLVEPITFSDNYHSLIAFEVETGENKYFNIERISDIIELNTDQEFQEKHKNDKPDIFGFSELNGEKFEVQLRLTLRAYLILKEEYPLVHPHVKKEPNNETYLLKCNVNNPKAITRFILGFPKDVEIMGSEKFKTFIFITHKQ